MSLDKSCCAEGMSKYGFIANMPIFLDSPEVLYARGDELGLTPEQFEKIAAVMKEARKNALDVLKSEQRKKLGAIPNEPITFAKICPMMHSEVDKIMNHAAKTEPSQNKTVKPQKQPKAVEQTVCPVMGGAINKELFTMYKDQKVYFCCPSCKGKFESDPDNYIGKLPQFGK